MKGDLHIHSKYSVDSRTEPDEIIKYAEKIGLKFISISDHNYFREYKSDRVIMVPGEEVSSRDGHILALFIQEPIPSGLSQEETVERIHNAGGIAVLAHPFRFVNGVRKKAVDVYDAIEIKNSRCGKGCNRKAKNLSDKWNDGYSVGSDAHFLFEVGRVWMEIPDGDIEDIRKAILAKNVTANGKDLNFKNRVSLYWKLGTEYAKRGFKRI